MGTNYYVEMEIGDACPVCKHRETVTEELHIGKSSLGWCFALHSIPEKGLTNLHNWLVYLKDKIIKDEYGSIHMLDEFKKVVLDRKREELWDHAPVGYASWPDFHRLNHSENGPCGMIRHKRNAGHGGEEPWDMCEGEFS